jgi:hypothetical protein
MSFHYVLGFFNGFRRFCSYIFNIVPRVLILYKNWTFGLRWVSAAFLNKFGKFRNMSVGIKKRYFCIDEHSSN